VVAPGNEPGTSGSVAMNSNHQTTEAFKDEYIIRKRTEDNNSEELSVICKGIKKAHHKITK
jgi:hypothetical protein